MNNNGDGKTMNGFRHPRHEATLRSMDKAVLNIPADQKYVIIIYDGGSIASWDRKASWISDAPEIDVKLICRTMSDQLKS